jgi:hypothetical protein
MNEIGIGVLFYNEIENARKILDDIRSHNLNNIDFYFLDNGSNNSEFTNWLLTIYDENVKILQVEKNLGFGGGAKFILRTIPNNFRGYMPGNYKVRPESLLKLSSVIALDKNLEVFKATRSGRSFVERVKTLAGGIISSAYFGTNMLDSGGTPTLVSSKYVENFQNGPDDFSYEAYLVYTARKLNLNLTRHPIQYGNRFHGSSHWQNGLKSEINLLFRIVSQKRKWNLKVKEILKSAK